MKTNINILISTLKRKLYRYIESNNPDILIDLNDVNLINTYIENKVDGIKEFVKELLGKNTPSYIIEEICIEQLTNDLKPSRYNYIVGILEEDFEFAHQQLKKSATFLYEIINIIGSCEPLFESFGFTEDNEGNRQLKYAITEQISEYLSK